MSQYLLSVHHDAAGDAAMAETAPDQRVPGGGSGSAELDSRDSRRRRLAPTGPRTALRV